jgi:hypothetical protein
LSDPDAAATFATGREPPCKRCKSRDWEIEPQEKGRLRWALETVFAAPDVWIFQSESAGWPGKQFELWTCRHCGHRARVS